AALVEPESVISPDGRFRVRARGGTLLIASCLQPDSPEREVAPGPRVISLGDSTWFEDEWLVVRRYRGAYAVNVGALDGGPLLPAATLWLLDAAHEIVVGHAYAGAPCFGRRGAA